MRFDIAIIDPEGNLSLIVELKNKLGTNIDWAAGLKRNMIAHQPILPKTSYFLLTLPDHFYLWEPMGNSPKSIIPILDINPNPFLDSYYKKMGLDPTKLSGDSFESVITVWLMDISQKIKTKQKIGEEEKRLIDSGLFDVFNNGKIQREVSV